MNALPRIGKLENRRNSAGGNERGWCEWLHYYWSVLWGFVGMVLFSLVFAVEFALRGLWVCDRKTAIAGGAGVELWPRKLGTARFLLEDMKAVKKAVPNAVSVSKAKRGLMAYFLLCSRSLCFCFAFWG